MPNAVRLSLVAIFVVGFHSQARAELDLTAADHVTTQITRIGFTWQLFFSL